MKKFSMLFLISIILSSNLYAIDIFETEKSTIKLSALYSDTTSSKSRSRKVYVEFKWKLHEEITLFGSPLSFLSKPYYEYSKTELETEQEKIESLGLEVLQVKYEAKDIKPFIGIGRERQIKDITDSDGAVSSTRNNLTDLTYGVEIPFGRKKGASISIYKKLKYDGLFDKDAGYETGVEFSIDLVKLFPKIVWCIWCINICAAGG